MTLTTTMDSTLFRKLGAAVETGVNERLAGDYALYAPRPGVMVTIASGHLALPFSHAIERVRSRLLGHSEKVVVFHDWEETASYDSEFRANNQRTAGLVAERLVGIHVLSKRGMVAMGVSTVGLALAVETPIVVQSIFERPKFEALLREALGQ